MNAGEVISRLQPHACSLSPRVDGWSIPEILPEDIAAALGTIKGDSGPSLIAHAKFGHEPRAARKLLARLKGAIITKWAPMETGRLHLFGMLVLEGTLMPSLCMTCHGRRELIVESLRIVCEPCSGTGIGQRSDKAMASALGVTRDEWANVWERRYCQMMDLVGCWEYEARRAIYGNLDDEHIRNAEGHEKGRDSYPHPSQAVQRDHPDNMERQGGDNPQADGEPAAHGQDVPRPA